MKEIYSDEELMHALKKKIEKAWKIFHDGRIKKLLNFARRHFNGHIEKDIDVEDLVQDALLKLYNNIEHFDNIHKAEYFLFTVIKNSTIDKQKQSANHSRKHNSIKENSPLSEDVIHENLVRTETANAVFKVISTKLDEKNAQIMRLFYKEKMSIPEIAQHLNLSEESVKSRKKRALVQLKEYFKNLTIPLLIAVLMNFIK